MSRSIDLITASAGTGKTYALTQRIRDAVTEGIDPERLVATTFTVKAAGELIARAQRALHDSGEVERAHRLSDGLIGTVNSVCGRLLSEYAIEAGISPAVEILPEDDAARIFRGAVSSVVARHAAELEDADRRLGYSVTDKPFAKGRDWRSDVQAMVQKARANALSPEEVRDHAASSWDALQEILGEPTGRDLDRELVGAVPVAIGALQRMPNQNNLIVKATEKLQAAQRLIDAGGEVPWKTWIELAGLGAGVGGATAVTPVNDVARHVLTHPRFQADVQTLVEGVFACAAEALGEYQAYKRAGGLVDFTDQEAEVLALLQRNASVRNALGERAERILVDEFQDTSPIQLALFLELHRAVGSSIWVGDPKQAIYGFRDTDPELMDEITRRLGGQEILSSSRRSRERVIEFTNALFVPAFADMEADRVRLVPAPGRGSDQTAGGDVETWNLCGKNNGEAVVALAAGVSDLLARTSHVPGEIAILCRSNNECKGVAGALEQRGLRASYGRGSLLTTREGALAYAALRYLSDWSDAVAIAELVRLTAEAGDATWFRDLVRSPKETIAAWREREPLERLDLERDHAPARTPAEALEIAIDAVLPYCGRAARGNLDALREACATYVEGARARRGAATVAGLVAHLRSADPPQAAGSGGETVNVLTYHGAKGLEWPVTILYSLDKGPRASLFAVDVEPAPAFDPDQPLANRTLRYWPWLLGSKKKFAPLDDGLDARADVAAMRERARKEALRLLYVGMTRAKDRLVLAVRKKTTKSGATLQAGWLAEAQDTNGAPLLELPSEAGHHDLSIGGDTVPVTTYEHEPEESQTAGESTAAGAVSSGARPMTTSTAVGPGDDERETSATATTDASAAAKGSAPIAASSATTQVQHVPARLSPSSIKLDECPGASSLDPDELATLITPFADLDHQISVATGADFQLVGNAVHAFLAAREAYPDTSTWADRAASILSRWGVASFLNAADVVEAAHTLDRFLEKQWPGADRAVEWPIAVRNNRNQLIQGWVDLLLETPQGYVIIDHKTYPGSDAAHLVQYVPQLTAYRTAIERATGRPVRKTLIHLPVSGLVYNFQLPAGG